MTKQRIKKNITKQSVINTNISHIETEKSNIIEIKEENTTLHEVNSEELPTVEIVKSEEVVIKKEQPKVKMWVKQKPLIIDLDPTVSANIDELDAEIKMYRQAIDQNLYARKRAIKGVLKYYEIKDVTGNLESVSYLKGEISQLSIPQPDKLIEK